MYCLMLSTIAIPILSTTVLSDTHVHVHVCKNMYMYIQVFLGVVPVYESDSDSPTTWILPIQLSINLAAKYLRELHVGRNAYYTSEQLVSELLQCLSRVIEQNILGSMRDSAFNALMTDKSTDIISVLKQLVLLGRYVGNCLSNLATIVVSLQSAV